MNKMYCYNCKEPYEVKNDKYNCIKYCCNNDAYLVCWLDEINLSYNGEQEYYVLDINYNNYKYRLCGDYKYKYTKICERITYKTIILVNHFISLPLYNNEYYPLTVFNKLIKYNSFI